MPDGFPPASLDCTRRAPKTGYTSPEKADYRERVWSAIGNEAGVFLTDPRAMWLLLPSREGAEIEVAIRHGIPEDRIIAIDENPALIAVSHWRKRWPRVKYFGCPARDVGKKIADRGWVLAGANLDLCYNFSESLINEVNAFLATTPRFHNFCIAVTIMKGREGSALARFVNETTSEAFSESRMAALFDQSALCSSPWSVLDQGKYRASKTAAIWAVLRGCPEQHPPSIRPLLAKIERLTRKAERIDRLARVLRARVQNDIALNPRKADRKYSLSHLRKRVDLRNAAVRTIDIRQEHLSREVSEALHLHWSSTVGAIPAWPWFWKPKVSHTMRSV
ncbi:hypothetical protein [Henriciella sp.]|uniref:hypothetical protein n=1 Tax=Henriciella sp. TaxID=1968823 RepID=UPI00261D6873|nr:hypothetical protein [Henriciella sp.]